MTKLLISNIGALFTPPDRARAGPLLGISDAEVEIEDGLVTYVGPARGQGHLPSQSMANPYPAAPAITHPSPGLTRIDAQGALVTPGLVDPHTHVIYGGNRAFEMPLKLAGVPYLEVLACGGGIRSTVRATREASDEELYESAATRLMAMVSQGTTTAEVKSGYGLSTDQELRLLGIIRELGRRLPLTIVPTFMGAHAVPEEARSLGTHTYVDEVVNVMLPRVAEQGVAVFCDVFCEHGVFSVKQTRRILESARLMGFQTKIHADEIAAGDEEMSGAELAAAVGCTSADHLRETPDVGLQNMKDSDVVPVVLPATSFCFGDERYARARDMIDRFDLPVALASDCNPGTSPTESLQLVMAISTLKLHLTPEEILTGVTANAARAIGLQDSVGWLAPGGAGDAVIWQAYELDLLPYRFGTNQASVTIKGGDIVWPAGM